MSRKNIPIYEIKAARPLAAAAFKRFEKFVAKIKEKKMAYKNKMLVLTLLFAALAMRGVHAQQLSTDPDADVTSTMPPQEGRPEAGAPAAPEAAAVVQPEGAPEKVQVSAERPEERPAQPEPAAPAAQPKPAQPAPAAEQPPPPARKSGGAVFGYGVLNLALGLGSFVQGDAGGGIMTLLSYGAAAGLIGWELSLSSKDALAGVPGAIGLGVAGFAVLYGFIRPAVYNKNRSLAKFMDGMRVAAAPVEGGGAAVRLSYTWKF